MNLIEVINTIVIIVGLPTILGAAVFIGGKLQIIEDVKVDMRDIKKEFVDMKIDMGKRFAAIEKRLAVVESRVGDLWVNRAAPSHSPRVLNGYGNDVLDKSGIKQIIDAKKDELLAAVKAKHVKNPYDAEQVVLAVVRELPRRYPSIIDELKVGAFQSGASLDLVFLVGGLYLRDLIFPDLGFSL
jgi:hypothetical protein